MAPLATDPFYIVRQEIQDTVNELQQKMSRFHGLTASNPERKAIASAVDQGCDSVRWQLNELENAVNRAQENPQRFNLSVDELNGRRKWITNTRRQIDGMTETLKTATAAPVNAAEARAIAGNDKFVGGEMERQQFMVRQQDAQLDDIEQAVTRLGRVGLDIHEELGNQEKMLDEFNEDVDTTHTRLKAAQKKMADVIRKSGSTTQLAVIAFLVIVLIILAVFVFY